MKITLTREDAARLGPRPHRIIEEWNRAISAACSQISAQIAVTGRETSKRALEQAYDAVRALKQ